MSGASGQRISAPGSLGRDLALAGGALLVLLVLPLIFPSKVLLDYIIRVAAFGIFATSLNMLVGFGGMVSFGHGMFFGGGAYAFGLMMQKLGVSIPVAFAGGMVYCALLALVVGAICIRLKETFFSFLTLAFQMLLHSIIISWVSLTGGDQGLMGGIPRPPFLGINLANQLHLYSFSCVLLVASLLLMRHILQTPFGYTLRMVRDNPDRARFLGIDIARIRLTAFVMAGCFGGVGGILMSLFVSGAYPEFAYWSTSGEAVFMIMMGGIHLFLGPIVGAAVFMALNDVITRFTEYHGLALGITVLIFALVFRRGLTDFVAQLRGGARAKP
ncbi:MAG TPA: branched-chain amino acid ABC transporter permease [Burkholderiaceae bacterium]|jgi:branched-chain amino acid transport system permease protein|nr:branched-chain amino acid ABC transporter permease [Burkholderiaceae bacterium]